MCAKPDRLIDTNASRMVSRRNHSCKTPDGWRRQFSVDQAPLTFSGENENENHEDNRSGANTHIV